MIQLLRCYESSFTTGHILYLINYAINLIKCKGDDNEFPKIINGNPTFWVLSGCIKRLNYKGEWFAYLKKSLTARTQTLQE